MKTDESCLTCNHKENLRYNYPCRSCVYPMAARKLHRLEITNKYEENRKKLLANPELLLEKLKAAAENADNFMWKDWNC